MYKNVEIVLSHEAEDAYYDLVNKSICSKKERMILNAFYRKVDILKSKPFFGDQIRKELIPDEYISRYDCSNLFRVELPCFWRMIYSVTSDDKIVNIAVLILDIFDHETYDQKFGYRKC